MAKYGVLIGLTVIVALVGLTIYFAVGRNKCNCGDGGQPQSGVGGEGGNGTDFLPVTAEPCDDALLDSEKKELEDLRFLVVVLKEKDILNEDGVVKTKIECGPGTKLNMSYTSRGRRWCMPCDPNQECPGSYPLQ